MRTAREAAEDLVDKLQRLSGAEARKFVETLDLDAHRYGKIFREFVAEDSDRAVAISIYALFDDVLLEVFSKYLNPNTPGGIDSMLNPSAFLGTSSNRLKLSVALGWMTNETYRGVNILRNIRNRFAHHIDTKYFDEHHVAGYISSLTILPNLGEISQKFGADILPKASKRIQFIFRSLGLFEQFILEIAILPCAMKFRVDPKYILSDQDDWPIYNILGELGAVAVDLIHRESPDGSGDSS
jgi:DNA-binding MltR family transcriptional regulator